MVLWTYIYGDPRSLVKWNTMELTNSVFDKYLADKKVVIDKVWMEDYWRVYRVYTSTLTYAMMLRDWPLTGPYVPPPEPVPEPVPPPEPTDKRIYGVVRDIGTQLPLPQAFVTWQGKSIQTDSEGKWQIIDPEEVSAFIKCFKFGYESYEVAITPYPLPFEHNISMIPLGALPPPVPEPEPEPEPELPPSWTDAVVAIWEALTTPGYIVEVLGGTVLPAVVEFILGRPPTAEDAVNIANAVSDWSALIRLFGKAVYNVDLQTGKPSSWEEVTPDEWALAIIEVALAAIGAVAVKKIGSVILSNAGLSLGPQSLSAAELTLVTELGRTAPMASPGLSSLLGVLSAKKVIMIISAAMGIDTWATWAATDNIATTVTMNVREIRDRVEDGTITREEGLKQLNAVMVYFDSAKAFVDASMLVNPILWFLAPTFSQNIGLAKEYITGLIRQVETVVPEVPSSIQTAIYSAKDNIDTLYFAAQDRIEILKFQDLVEQSDIDGAKSMVDAARLKVTELNAILEENKEVLVAAGVYDTHALWADAKDEALDALEASIPGLTPPVLPPTAPSAGLGNIEVTSDPDKASIYLNNNLYTFPTPTVLKDVSPGQHIIRLSKLNYANYEETVTVVADQVAKVHGVLQPLPPVTVNVGTLKVQANVGPTEVYSAGTIIGTTDAAGLASIELDQGYYTIMLKKIGYVEYTRDVFIRGGQETVLTATLQEEVVQKQAYRVSVNATDPDGVPLRAKIFINGYLYDWPTPTIIYMDPGAYSFRFELTGYESAIANLNLPAFT